MGGRRDADRERLGACGGGRRRARPGGRRRSSRRPMRRLRRRADRRRPRRPGLGAGLRGGRAGRGHGAPAATPPARRHGHAHPRPARRARSGRPAGSRSRPRTTRPEYNGLKFFQPEGMVLGAEQGAPCSTRWQRPRVRLGGLGRAWAGSASSRTPTTATSTHAHEVDVGGDPPAAGSGRARRLPRRGGRLGAAAPGAGLPGRRPGGRARRPLRPPARADRGQPADVRRDRPGRRRGGRLRPGPRRRPAGDRRRDRPLHRRGADPGPGRPARGSTRPRGPVVLNLSTSRVTEDLARRLGCPVHPDAGRRDPRRRADAGRGGGARRRGERRRDRPAGRVRPRQLRRRWPWCSTCWPTTGEPLSALVDALPRFAMVKDQYPAAGTGAGGRGGVAALWDRIAAAHPEAEADRRDGLRLDWPDRWVHVRASNTEPIVRVIAEAAEPAEARAPGRRESAGWVDRRERAA